MVTSKMILELANPNAFGYAGKVETFKRAMRPQGGGFSVASYQRLAAEAREIATAPRGERYSHPEDDPRTYSAVDRLQHPGVVNGGTTHHHEFTATDLAWLQRLPDDPAKVSFEDATHLASLARASSKFADKSGALLIQSAWRAVKEVHDARQGEVALRNARQPLLKAPEGITNALADALREEMPVLTEEEAVSRARAMLSEQSDQLEAGRAQLVDDAKAAIDAAAAATVSRTSPVKVA